MTLFTLLIVMALERVITKTKALHISTLAQSYFSKTTSFGSKQKEENNSGSNNSVLIMLLIAGVPAVAVWLFVAYMPGIFVFFSYLLLLWICLGCPVTRQTYKRYLNAANREDFEACSLYSEKFGVKDGDLSNVGKQLVLVNYRQYASVIIFFVILGLPGMVFYSLCKEWYLSNKDQAQSDLHSNPSDDETNDSNIVQQHSKLETKQSGEEKVMFVLDWIPARVTAFGFLLVGHFSKGLPAWLNTFLNPKLSAYEVLTNVAISSEEIVSCENRYLQEPLQMVRLVKRNVIFLLMVISVLTLVGMIT